MSLDQYAHVPDVAQDAEPDPHWQELRAATGLPTAYLPGVMGSPLRGWRRPAAWVLVVMFLSATSGGICLTYGPHLLASSF